MHIKFVPFGQGEAHEALGWVFKEHTPNGDGFIGGDLYQWAGEGFPVHPQDVLKEVPETQDGE